MMLGVVGLIAIAVFYFRSLPVSSSRLEKLNVGMTTNEVAALLGNPQVIYIDRSRETNKAFADFYLTWTYESPFHFFVVDVFFDSQGHYTRHWWD